MRRFFILLFALSLSACGFHLRGQAKLPFTSVYVQAMNERAPLVLELKRDLEANGIQISESPEQAQLVLEIVRELPERKILSLGATGRVLEYQLVYRVSLRAHDQKQVDWLPADELILRRDFTYDDTKVLSKQQEEILLYEHMRSDMVQQIIRRLTFAKPRAQE
ncbi:MAG: hypothetical protein HY849_05405 [Nitrosomonadales bacterium]|nr:hypothetical protein [Nitrosomonadales bacterium]